MANQYIFFDAGLCERFIAFAREAGLAVGVPRPDPIAGMVVELPDDLDDELQDAIEVRYDALMDEQRELVDAEGEEAGDVVMGVDVTLPDGSPCTVRLPADLGRRLSDHFNGGEIHALVSAIAASVANPSAAPLCCRKY